MTANAKTTSPMCFVSCLNGCETNSAIAVPSNTKTGALVQRKTSPAAAINVGTTPHKPAFHSMSTMLSAQAANSPMKRYVRPAGDVHDSIFLDAIMAALLEWLVAVPIGAGSVEPGHRMPRARQVLPSGQMTSAMFSIPSLGDFVPHVATAV